MIVLVCGGRDYKGDICCLEAINISIMIHGNCEGADKRAGSWAEAIGIHVAKVDALWRFFGNTKMIGNIAGPRRNKAMLLLKPDYCVAFPGGSGTAGMIQLCKEAGVTVWTPYG